MDFIRSKLSKKKRNDGTESSKAAGASASSLIDDENQSGNGLSLEHFQIQLLLDCLIRVKYNSSDNDELITMCAEQINDNRRDLHMLNEFKNRYSSNRALWWYLQECFLYKILNYSLESQDIRNLFLFRKVLHDIEQHIRDHRCSSPLHVYRSQLVPNTLLDKWISSVGQCIVVNSFLSATTNPDVALTYLKSDQVIKDDYCRVLIEIDADPRIPGSKPFVHTGSLSYASDKDEVLFMFGSVFMINNITCEDDNLYRIEMTLYSDSENELKQVFDDMKQKYGDGELDLLTFVQILYDFDKLDEAEEYANRYLEGLPSNHEDALQCYNLLGSITLSKSNFEASLTWYKLALEFQSRMPDKYDSVRISETHENIGNIYWKEGSYDLALKHYLTSLELKNSVLPPHHPEIAGTLENIGRIYESKREFSHALEFFQKAKSIFRHGLPATQDKVSQIDEHIRRISHNSK